MKFTAEELNDLPPERASELFAACVAVPRWVSLMVALRPFGSVGAVRAASEETWRLLHEEEIRAAFAHHPRIGERASDAPQNEQGASWSADEQGGVDAATADVLSALAAINREYEERFGYIYIVCATGKPAEQMLALAQERMRNDPATELLVAIEEQRKIMRLRLEKMLDDTTEKRVYE